MNNIALIRPTAIKDSLGWFHPADSVFRKKTTTTSRSSEMTNRWIVNPGGQYIDSGAVVDPSATSVPATPWGTEDEGTTVSTGHNNSGLSNDLARLKISANADADAQVESTRLSRPASKLPTAAVAQIVAENTNNNTSSPLDSSSSNSSSSPHTPDHGHLHHQISHSRGASADTPNHHRYPHVLPQPYITSQHPHQSTPSSGSNSNSNSLLTHLKTSSTSSADSSKERPRSFSGDISVADLRRLSQGGPGASPITGADDHDRQPQSPWVQEQLSYPSLATQQQRPFHNFSYPTSNDINTPTTTDDDQHYTRSFASVPPPQTHSHPHQLPSPRTQFMPVSSRAAMPMNYRRTYTPQGPSPLSYGHHTTHHSLGNTQHLYEMMLPAGLGDNHPSSLSRGLGASAGGSGIQQSPSVFRATHHHSASDPSALRDPTTLALLNNNMQTFSPGMFQPGMHSMHPQPPPPIYPGQFYSQELAMQQLLNARMQAAQAYTGPYGMPAAATGSSPQPAMSMDNINSGLASPGSSNGGAGGNGGPSANNRKLGLYKTELCRSWEEKGSCRYGTKCQFAHGEEELRKVARHPKYKTEICKTFWVSGSCPYGKRCCFIHTELSSVQPGANPGSPESAPQLPSSPPSSNGNATSNGNVHHRERSNSDPDTSTSVSLLTRISQRSQNNQDDGSPTMTPVSSNLTTFSHSLPLTSRPPTGSLRVDTTNVEPNLSLKQNKSAYPTFASNGILLGGANGTGGGAGSLEFGVGSGSLGEGGRGMGAGVGLNGAVGRFRHEVPVTAGPDLGRHNLARMEIVGYPTHQRKGSASSITNAHHSLSGSDIDLSFSPSPPGSSGHSYSLSTSSDTATSTTSNMVTTTTSSSVIPPVQPTPTRLNGHGHVRTGSAGTLNWGSSFTGAGSGGGSSSASRNSSHPLSTSVGSATWVGELTARVGNEKTWA